MKEEYVFRLSRVGRDTYRQGKWTIISVLFGISFAPTLLGKKKQKKHDFLYWEFDETDQIAVRMDDWKMVVKKGTPFLYNLKTDIHEDTDIALQHPDVVEKMKAIIFEQHTPNPYFSVTLPKQ